MELDLAEMALGAAIGSVAPYAAVALWQWVRVTRCTRCAPGRP